MDTNVPAAVLSYFDLSADAFPWRDPRPPQIERRRAALGDLLLFDILLTSGGIREPDTLYPPVDIDSFHRLLEAIQTSTYDALKRDCLVYFLLKWYQDGREEKYKLEKCIPPQFASLSDAYWHLDAGTNIPVRILNVCISGGSLPRSNPPARGFHSFRRSSEHRLRVENSPGYLSLSQADATRPQIRPYGETPSDRAGRH
jgi:hypothetical protein